MHLPSSGSYIDVKGQRLVSVREISRRFVRLLDEAETLKLLCDEAVAVFRRDYDQTLVKISSAERPALRSQAEAHITDATDDFDLASFGNGYCFIASQWKGNSGLPILVLHCQH
ncbi:MAG: hypothetical protein ACIAXF_14305 [Phycisphaerales bacterium JB063]